MTEKSYFHDGVAFGDADLAPYSNMTYTTLLDLIHTSGQAYVVYSTAVNNFLVSAGAGMTVSVGSGVALVNGITCSRGIATTLTIAGNTSGYPRMDRVIIRALYNAAGYLTSASLQVKNGRPSDAPVSPELVQELGSVYEVPLARVYVPDGAAAIQSYYIFDEREFIEDTNTVNLYSNENIFRNSEFIAGAGTGIPSSGVGVPPAEWTGVLVSTCTNIPKFARQNRGMGISTTLLSGADSYLYTANQLNLATATPYTLRFYVQVYTGTLYISVDGGGSYILRVEPTNDPVEVIIRGSTTFVSLRIGNNNAGTVEFDLGQVTLAYGNVGAPYTPKQETILYSTSVPHPDWNPKTTGFPATIAVYLSSVDEVGYGTRELLAKIKYLDSGSAGSANSFAGVPTGNSSYFLRVDVSRLPNSSPRTVQGLIKAHKILPALVPTAETSVQAAVGGTPSVYFSFLGCRT